MEERLDTTDTNQGSYQVNLPVNYQSDPAANALENHKIYGMDLPSAPPHWQEDNATSNAQGTPQADPPRAKRSSRHMLYSVEILVFAIVGWGWLALREYMGATPVLDVSVIICLLVSSVVNLALSLVYHTTDQFKPAAQAFFAHVLSLWALYVYGLAESITGRPYPLCCNGASTFSVPGSYAAAYFGGLPFHQAAGMVTLAFLSVLVVVAAAQVRVCLADPREWLARDALLAIVCLFSFHLALFTRAAGVCGEEGLGIGVMVAASLALVVMLHAPQDAVALRRWLKQRKGGGGQDNSQEQRNKKLEVVLDLIQRITELTAIVLLIAMTGVLSSKLGGAPSPVLLVVCCVAALFLAVGVAAAAVECRRATPDQPVTLPEEKQAQNSSLGYRYRSGRPVMVLPSAREMRLHGARRREKRAW